MQKIRNGKARNNKSGTVKRGTASLVRYNADYLDLKFTIFQCKSNRILVFTPVEGFSNILFIHHLNCYQLHIYIIYFFVSCKNLPCDAMLISHIMQLLFFIANSPKTSFFCLYYHSCDIFVILSTY